MCKQITIELKAIIEGLLADLKHLIDVYMGNMTPIKQFYVRPAEDKCTVKLQLLERANFGGGKEGIPILTHPLVC